jgi:hypothetical protein
MSRLTRHDWTILSANTVITAGVTTAVVIIVIYHDDPKPLGALLTTFGALTVSIAGCIGGLLETRRHGPGDHL